METTIKKGENSLGEIAIKISGLKKLYKTRAISYNDMEIKKGELVAITGESGSGKTTLLSILGLLDGDFLGEYFLFGENIKNLSQREMAEKRKKEIAFVFQEFNLIDSLKVFGNVALPLRYGNAPKDEIKKRCDEALFLVGLRELGENYPKNLSGGQRQRVAIARAAAQLSPKLKGGLILADEPTGALDKASAEAVMNLFFRLNKEGKTILIITHDEKIAKMCQREIKI